MAAKSHAAIQKDRYSRLKSLGLCPCCGEKSDGKVLCQKCRSVARIRRERLKESGICIECGCNESLKNHNKCYECYFIDITKRLGGRNKKLARQLRDKFELQGAKCFYTDRPLILGDNASVEHTLPRSRGGGNGIDNLLWVDKNVNFMKNSLTHEEFVGFCKFVAGKFGGE